MLILATVLKLWGGDGTTMYTEVASLAMMWTHCGKEDYAARAVSEMPMPL